MKKLLFQVSFLMIFPVWLYAQDKGVKFETGLSWKQIQAKAKAENKYVFVDGYATWCGPCKLMDQNTYPSEKVGDVVNTAFISVKAQMDSTKADNAYTKSWYADARELMSRYNVTAFPSFLFFSTDGKLVHRGVGYLKADDFIKVVKSAADPERQYYTLVELYKKGKLGYDAMPYLSDETSRFKDDQLSMAIGMDYIRNYLYKLPDNELYTPEHIHFLAYHSYYLNWYFYCHIQKTFF